MLLLDNEPTTLGPRRTQTHWKQTVFYLLDTFPVAEGDVLHGHVSCGPNKGNNRDLDIEVRCVLCVVRACLRACVCACARVRVRA